MVDIILLCDKPTTLLINCCYQNLLKVVFCTNNPKEYWKILNSGRHKKQPNISIENLLQFKKKLNGAHRILMK
jgi:uncharacterized pyridoxamine 5'-phosphate oxidase family protein